MSEIKKILEGVHATGFVSADLLPLVYEELRSAAAQQMSRATPGQTLQATALVHEAWLKLTKEDARLWSDRARFFRAAALAMRHILVDRARAKARHKRTLNTETLSLHELDLADATIDDRILLVNDVMDQLERHHSESARVVTLKFFGGLTNKEIASMDGVTERTIERQWAYAKVMLYRLIRKETD